MSTEPFEIQTDLSYERVYALTLKILPRLMLWEGWRVCCPFSVAGLTRAVIEHDNKSGLRIDLRSGLVGKPVPSLILGAASRRTDLMAELVWAGQSSEPNKFENIARDGEIAILAPSRYIATVSRTKWQDHSPDLYIERTVPGPSLTWFVWSRKTTGKYQSLE